MAEYGRDQLGGVEEQQIVPAFNLDWLLTKLPTPQIIKIDVEGAQVEVLRGQQHMLNEVRPVIICEVGSAASSDITDIFNSVRYRLYDGDKPLKPYAAH